MYQYKESQMKKVIYADEIGEVTRFLCPECYDHEQGSIHDVRDCKNEYQTKRGFHGQCSCYSLEHGKRNKF